MVLYLVEDVFFVDSPTLSLSQIKRRLSFVSWKLLGMVNAIAASTVAI
jgi:hypothetical protein